MVFNATFNNISAISWRSVSLMDETGVPGENRDLPQITDKLNQIMLYRVHLAWAGFELTKLVVICTDSIGIVWYLDLQLHVQSVPITAKVLSSNPVHGETLCDKVCQWLATGWWFSPCTPVSSTNKTDRHDITPRYNWPPRYNATI